MLEPGTKAYNTANQACEEINLREKNLQKIRDAKKEKNKKDADKIKVKST